MPFPTLSGCQSLKQILKRVPGMRPAVRYMRDRREISTLGRKSAEDVFTEICREKSWSRGDSVSGTGSDLAQTRAVREELPKLLREYLVQSMLDIPCGDFHWMRRVELAGVEYTGADIVGDLVERNLQYETAGIRFRKLNLIEDELPKVDLVFCRDCLVHLSYKDGFAALSNICASGARYLLTTTFPARESNRDIASGQWRMLNLRLAPFGFPPPLKVIDEGCTEGDAYRDKSLGLWAVDVIRERLEKRDF